MARDRRRHACGAEGLEAAPATTGMPVAGPLSPGKSRAKPAQGLAHRLPADRALFLHLIRALAQEAARADDVVDSPPDAPRT